MKPSLWISNKTGIMVVLLANALNESMGNDDTIVYCDTGVIERQTYCANRQWFYDNYRRYDGQR